MDKCDWEDTFRDMHKVSINARCGHYREPVGNPTSEKVLFPVSNT